MEGKGRRKQGVLAQGSADAAEVGVVVGGASFVLVGGAQGFGALARVVGVCGVAAVLVGLLVGALGAVHDGLVEPVFGYVRPTDDDPPWVRYFDRTKLTVDIGIALGQLGDAGSAEPLIAEALRSEPETNLRGRAFHSFWLARTQLQRGHVEAACRTASDALNLSTTVDSPRVTAHLQEFRQLLTPFRSFRPVAELDARLMGAAG
ncbi:hypothetical protein [Streptomyces sp. NPDC058280]|uniref:hypothetical protein n=1 Tax=Streptomyces sp. NPDC058280 TaxID=3346419 RepID=UPI0036E3BA30